MSTAEEKSSEANTKICVIGVGGGGCNALETMIAEGIGGVSFIACNTDMQALGRSHAGIKIQLGKTTADGKGAGANPGLGAQAADESRDEIARALEGFDLAFIAAGMGGGTGTGAAPVIAEIARSKGILTLSIVTTPFLFEGQKRLLKAEAGISALGCNSDTLIVVSNSSLARANPDVKPAEAYALSNSVLLKVVQAICKLMFEVGYINVDFADLRTIMSNKMQTRAVVGMGHGQGPNAAFEAFDAAIHSSMLDDSDINGAQGILYTIECGDELTISQLEECASAIQRAVNDDADIIFGASIDSHLAPDEVIFTLVATGIPMQGKSRVPEQHLGPKMSMTPVPALPPSAGNQGSSSLPPISGGLRDPRASLPPSLASEAGFDMTPFEGTLDGGAMQPGGENFAMPQFAGDEDDLFSPAHGQFELAEDMSESMAQAYPKGYLVADIPTLARQGGSTQIPRPSSPLEHLGNSDIDVEDLDVPTILRKKLQN